MSQLTISSSLSNRLKLASGGERERLIEKEEREIVERRENKKDEAKVFEKQ